MRACACACACFGVCVCLLHGAPQTEVRRSPEQVQIELNLIPHCAGTGMKLHNCTLIDDRTPAPLLPPPPPHLFLPLFCFSCWLRWLPLCILSLKFRTWASGCNYLLASLCSSFLFVPREASNNVFLSNQGVIVVGIRAITNQ